MIRSRSEANQSAQVWVPDRGARLPSNLPSAQHASIAASRQRRRLARLQVHADQRRAARRGADAVAEDRLRDLERGAAELGDAGADLDGAGPVQLLHVIDLHAHHDEGHARHADAEVGVAEHRHPAALEIGQEHRLVDVALRVEIAEADDFGDAVRVIGKLRRGLGAGCRSVRAGRSRNSPYVSHS